jgi:hypothetical protein
MVAWHEVPLQFGHFQAVARGGLKKHSPGFQPWEHRSTCEQNTGWKPMLCYIDLPDCRAISHSHPRSYRRAPE